MSAGIRVRVAAVIIERDRILLVQHHKDGQDTWLLPGGGVDPGETLHAALARELAEETGYGIAPGALRFTAESIAPDASRHILHVGFMATRTGEAFPRVEDPRVVGFAWHPLEVLRMLPMYPAFGEELYALLIAPDGPPRHLGNRWI